MTLEDAVIVIVPKEGNLLASLELIDTNTWQTSQEVWSDFMGGNRYRGRNTSWEHADPAKSYRSWNAPYPYDIVYTANIGIYRLVDDEVVFDLLGREGNPFVGERFRQEAYRGILNNEFFFPQTDMKEHIMAAITAGVSVTVHYSGFRDRHSLKSILDEPNNEYLQFHAYSISDEERKLFFGVYGTEDLGGTENIWKGKKEGWIEGKKIYLLKEEIVRAKLHNKADELIAVACFFSYYQDFWASKYSYFTRCAVRGVPREEIVTSDSQKVSVAPQETDKIRTANDTVFGNLISPLLKFFRKK